MYAVNNLTLAKNSNSWSLKQKVAKSGWVFSVKKPLFGSNASPGTLRRESETWLLFLNSEICFFLAINKNTGGHLYYAFCLRLSQAVLCVRRASQPGVKHSFTDRHTYSTCIFIRPNVRLDNRSSAWRQGCLILGVGKVNKLQCSWFLISSLGSWFIVNFSLESEKPYFGCKAFYVLILNQFLRPVDPSLLWRGFKLWSSFFL